MTNRTTGAFSDLDFTDFWEDYSDPAEPAPSDELVSSIEEEVGFGYRTHTWSSPESATAASCAAVAIRRISQPRGPKTTSRSPRCTHSGETVSTHCLENSGIRSCRKNWTTRNGVSESQIPRRLAMN